MKVKNFGDLAWILQGLCQCEQIWHNIYLGYRPNRFERQVREIQNVWLWKWNLKDICYLSEVWQSNLPRRLAMAVTNDAIIYVQRFWSNCKKVKLWQFYLENECQGCRQYFGSTPCCVSTPLCCVPTPTSCVSSSTCCVPSSTCCVPSFTCFVPSLASRVPSSTCCVPSFTRFVPSLASRVSSSTCCVPSFTRFVPSLASRVPSSTCCVPSFTRFVQKKTETKPKLNWK